jgi:hypothetical protein
MPKLFVILSFYRNLASSPICGKESMHLFTEMIHASMLIFPQHVSLPMIFVVHISSLQKHMKIRMLWP